MGKQIDKRVENMMGYYEKPASKNIYFKHLSFDTESGLYFVQQGVIKNDKTVKLHVPKIIKYAGSVEKVIDEASVESQNQSMSNEGYQKKEVPSYVKSALQSFAEIQTKEPRASKKDTDLENLVIPMLELVEGNNVRIGKQVVSENAIACREETIPKINPHYAFPEMVNDIILDMLESRKLMLTGHTGCGKTSIVEQIAARLKYGTVRSNMNGQTTVHDFVGMWTVKGGETVWVDGVLPMAMKEGLWLIIDEIDCADPSILAVLNSVLEENGCLTLKEKGQEIVKPHQNFRVFATANTAGCMAEFRPLYQGTNTLNEAFLDRFRVYKCDYLPEHQEIKVLTDCVPKLNEKVAKDMVSIANQIRKMFLEEGMSSTFSTRRLLDWANMYVRHNSLLRSAENVLFAKMNRTDAESVRDLLQRKGAK